MYEELAAKNKTQALTLARSLGARGKEDRSDTVRGIFIPMHESVGVVPICRTAVRMSSAFDEF